MARLTTALWVAALVRRANDGGAFASLAKTGASEAGAIYVMVGNQSGQWDLFAPAVQTAYLSDGLSERLFEKVSSLVSEAEITERLASERRFDPDIWIVEIEDRQMRSFLPEECIA